MAGTDNRQQDLGDGSGSGAGRTGAIGRAEDLRGFLQQLSDQFADADRRHSESMRDMRERLARLGDQTIDLKHAMPSGFEADLERLEAGMLQLAQRMADAEQPRSKPAVTEPSCAVHVVPAPADAQETARSDSWAVAPPPALKSAVIGTGGQSWSRAEPVSVVEVTAPVSLPLSRSDDEPWDKTSADALASLYDSGEPGLPKLPDPIDAGHDVSSLATAAPEQHLRVTPAVQSLKSTAGPLLPEITQAAIANHFASAETAAVQRSEADRLWLESQLADLAHRVDRSLVELKPESAVADLNRRFDELEDRWNSALADVATRSDVEGLKIVEAHITELTQKLEQAQAQFARLDVIEAQLADVAGQLSDDQIVRIFGGLVPTEEDLSRFAETAAEKVAARMMTEMPQSMLGQTLSGQVPAEPIKVDIPPSLEANQIEANERITQLHELLQGFIEERRRMSAETAEALDTMQQAMQHVLDRVDSIEAAVPQTAHVPASNTDVQLAGVASHLEQAMPKAAARMVPEAAPVSGQDIYEEAKAAAKAAAAAAGRGGQPAQGSKARAPYAPRGSEPSLDASASELQGDVEDAHERAPRGVRGVATSGRNSVLENARRAAERARVASANEEEAPKGKASLMVNGRGGKADSAGKGERSGVMRVVVALCSVAFLAACFWLYFGLGRSIGTAPRIQQSAPASKATNGTTSKALPVTVEDEGEPTDKEGKASGGDKIDEKQDGPKEGTSERRPDRRSEAPIVAPPLKRAVSAAVEGQSVQGSVTLGGPGIAIQHSPGVSQSDIVRAREQMNVAALSHRTAENAAQGAVSHAANATVAPVMPVAPTKAALGGAPEGAQGAPVQADGKTVLELPPALVGPLSLRLAAAKGDPSAQFEVAARFAEGKGIKQDFGQAAAWYQRAANQGLPIAQYRLAALFERGLGVKPDPARARIWYKRAAEQGNVKAMHNLAVLSAGRDQNAADYPAAVQWFSEAAERGLPDSQYNLGVLYESGLGVAKDPLAAYKWYALAARSGDREAARRYEGLRAKLDPLNLKAAEESVAAWKSRPIETASNDAMTAGSAWKARAGSTSE